MEGSRFGLVGDELFARRCEVENLMALSFNAQEFVKQTSDRFGEGQPEGTLPWGELTPDDRLSMVVEIQELIFIEDSFPRLDSAPRLSTAACEALFSVLDGYRDALPCSPAEWRWLRKVIRTGDFQDPDDVRRISVEATRLTSQGIRRNVTGQELLSRYWDWRRGGGEFAGQDTYDLARGYLGRLATLISVDL